MRVGYARLGALLVVFMAALFFVAPVAAEWRMYEETRIVSEIRGSIRRGHIFKTQSGHMYEVVEYVYLYEYESNPEVLVLSDGSQFKLIIDGFDDALVCRCLNCDTTPAESSGSAPESDQVIIKVVQTSLTDLGFDAGSSDGVLTPQTLSAVKRFRAAVGLSATESVDAVTLQSLGTALAKKHPESRDALAQAVFLLQVAKEWQVPLRSQGASVTVATTPAAFESYIASEFRGLDRGNIYKLANGQIWEQTEAWVWVWVWVNPKVLIWKDGGVYRMKVERIDHAVTVQRLK